MKTNLFAIAVGTVFSASAFALPVSSFDLPGGPLYVKFDGSEQIAATQGAYTYQTSTVNEINWGVLVVSTINAGVVDPIDHNKITPAGSALFSNISTANAQITGMFYGIEGLPQGTGGNPFPATGGRLDLYWRDLGTFSQTTLSSSAPSVRTGFNSATGFTDGNLLVSLKFSSGINTNNSNVFINGSVVPSSGTGFAGLATSYAEVDLSAGGLWATKFDTDWFNTLFGTRDFRFRNTYEELVSWNNLPNGIVGANLTDPGTTVAVPEPASLALLGLGFLGLAGVRRRK